MVNRFSDTEAHRGILIFSPSYLIYKVAFLYTLDYLLLVTLWVQKVYNIDKPVMYTLFVSSLPLPIVYS